MPKTMRAGVYREKGVVRVEEVPVPEVGDGEVLIKVAACGICGTDIKKIFQRYVEPPQILGHELAGTVVAIGRGVSQVEARRPRHELSPYSLRRMFLLQEPVVFAMQAIQEHGADRGVHAEWRRLRRVREGDALGRGPGNCGAAGQCEL